MDKQCHCTRCGQTISFILSQRGEWLLINPDQTDHFKSCTRKHLFGQSRVKCSSCDVYMVRDSGEWQSLITDFFPSEDYKMLKCPCCNWFYEWYSNAEQLTYAEVEKYIIKNQLKHPTFQYKLSNGKRITKSEAT